MMWNGLVKHALTSCYFCVLKDSEDENNEQTQDAYGERHTDQRRDNVSLIRKEESKRNESLQSESEQRRDNIPLIRKEESKRNENLQRESEQRRDSVPLRDSNKDTRRVDGEPGVQVVAPTENSMNKWANIIKVNSSFDTTILNV